MTQNQKDLLRQELSLITAAIEALETSYKRCAKAIKSARRSIEDLERLEALTSRFARLSDILVQKVFRLIDMIELETEGSVLDRIHRAEKRGLVGDAEECKKMRYLRNRIAHEYLKESLEDIFSQVFFLTPMLLKDSRSAIVFCETRYGVNG